MSTHLTIAGATNMRLVPLTKKEVELGCPVHDKPVKS